MDKVSAEGELPVRLCNYVDVYKNDLIHSNLPFMEGTATSEEIAKFGLGVGDVIITKDSEDWRDIAVPAIVQETAPDLVCGYHLSIVRADCKRILPRFLFELFRSRAVNTQLQVSASGVTRYGLPKAALGDAIIPLPPLNEQAQIADFLDRETAKIDTLIAKKRELIERLKEKRTALISHVVTKGLPPEEAAKHGLAVNPPLKPSGVPWLGDIPEHWAMKPFKSQFRFVSGGTPNTATAEYWDGDIPWISSKDVKRFELHDTEDHITQLAVQESATTMIGKGSLFLVARSGILRHTLPVGITQREMAINQDIKGCLPNPAVVAEYFGYLIQGHNAELLALWRQQGATVESLAVETVRSSLVPVPPKAEQVAIARYVRTLSSALDETVLRVTEVIERLQEYRSALITAAVTGKIDVRTSI